MLGKGDKLQTSPSACPGRCNSSNGNKCSSSSSGGICIGIANDSPWVSGFVYISSTSVLAAAAAGAADRRPLTCSRPGRAPSVAAPTPASAPSPSTSPASSRGVCVCDYTRRACNWSTHSASPPASFLA